MSWDFPSSFRREFRTSISNYLKYLKFQEVKNLGWSKIVGLTITRAKTKKYGFCVQRIALPLIKSKEILTIYVATSSIYF